MGVGVGGGGGGGGGGGALEDFEKNIDNMWPFRGKIMQRECDEKKNLCKFDFAFLQFLF
jgi:hypothetical protein